VGATGSGTGTGVGATGSLALRVSTYDRYLVELATSPASGGRGRAAALSGLTPVAGGS